MLCCGGQLSYVVGDTSVPHRIYFWCCPQHVTHRITQGWCPQYIPPVTHNISNVLHNLKILRGFGHYTYIVDNIGYPVRVSIPALCCGERLLYCGCMLWRYSLWVHIYCGDRTYIVGICCGQNPLMAYPVGDDMLWVTFFLCCPQHMLVFSTACICCGACAVEKSSCTDVMCHNLSTSPLHEYFVTN